MKHFNSDSDVTSLATTSPPHSPKRPAYYVQSPSRDSRDDGDKSSSMRATPVYNSPMESPSHPSFGPQSRASSASRFSGNLRSSPGGKGCRKHLNEKGWPECNVIQEEGAYGELDGEQGLSRSCVFAFWLSVLVLVFAIVCLIVWGAARPYKPDIVVKSLAVNNFYAGEGTDYTGVPTKLVTMNCSLKIHVHNPSTMFGIHVSSSSIRLMYLQIAIANGQLSSYYQPRTSRRDVAVILHGEKVPLYGAGAGLSLSITGIAVPLTLDLAITARGYVIGKLVRVTHRKRVECPLIVDSRNSKPARFLQSACTAHP